MSYEMEKGTPATPTTSIPEVRRTAFLAMTVEEITQQTKKLHVVDKGKEKAFSRSSSVWDDASLAMSRAKDAFMADELKALSRVPSNELVGRYVHKLI